jgi:hypothetical protein
MTTIIDCTTPEKLEAFGQGLLEAGKSGEPVDLQRVALIAEMKRWHAELQWQEAKDRYDDEDYRNEAFIRKQRSKAIARYDAVYRDGFRPWLSR